MEYIKPAKTRVSTEISSRQGGNKAEIPLRGGCDRRTEGGRDEMGLGLDTTKSRNVRDI